MIKRSIFLVLAMTATLMHSVVVSAEMKIGVYNNRAIIDNLPQVQKELEKLNAEFEPKRKEITDKQAKLLALKEDIEKNGPVLSQADRQAKSLKYQSSRRELQLLAEDTERVFNVRRNDVARQIQGMVENEVVKLGKEEQYDLIFRSGVLYASPAVDITQKVLQRLSEK